MQRYLISSLILTAICISIFVIPQANALPVSYNQTALNFGLTSIPRNSSSYDVFTLNQDNWLWEKFDNNTVDSSPLSVNSTITYNTNLKALWKFQNTTTDSSTNARTLTKGAGTNTFSTSGQEGKAIQFNGVTWYSASDGSLPTGTNPVSISTWINPSSLPANQLIFSYGTGAGHLFAVYIDGINKLEFYNGSTGTIISTSTFSTSTWYYITITYDGTNARVYINGSLDKTTAITVNTVLGGASGFTLGSLGGGTGTLFNGKMDEFRVYSGTALTLAQHQALYMIGHYSQSHTFDGGEYITSSSQFMPTGTQDRTESFWIYLPSYPSSIGYVTSYGVDAGNNMFGIGITSTGNVDVVGSGNDVTGTAVIPLNTWTFVTVKLSSGGTVRDIYINNVLDKESTTTALNTSTSQLYIGTGFYNTALTITGQLDNLKVYPYALSSSQITSDYNSISPISSGKQFMSWYNGVSGSATLTQKLGTTKSSITLSCNLNTITPEIISNNTNLYYMCNNAVNQVPITSGITTLYFHSQDDTSTTQRALFSTKQNIMVFTANSAAAVSHISTKSANTTLGFSVATAWTPISNQKIHQTTTGTGLKYYMNTTSLQTVGSNACEINFSPSNTTKLLDSIACDQSLPANSVKYWQGMSIIGNANYATNSTQQFLSSIDANSYKKLLSLPCLILVNETPCVTFIATDFTNTDYLVVLTSTHVYYGNAQTALHLLQNNNYALQSYDIITPLTTSAYEIQNPILQGITLYGFNLNTTVNKAGLFTLPSGYTTKTTTINSAIRTIDPRWTNDATDIPIITTTQSLFPIYLTASNAPSFAAIKVTQPTQILNGQESVYAVAQLDSTRSVEFDLVAGTCANIYIADISVSPTVWNFEGIICATGVNQKTVAYTNTVPFTFYTLKYGVTDSYVPSNNGLQTTFRTQAAPTTYTVIVRNSTGTVAINQTFTVPANQTVDTRTFNVSSVSKPASLAVTVGGNMVYSSYLGSALSLATVSSFFHQYFSYQGFDLVAFIPVIFASAFTRNTVGAGMVLVVLMIATLSWLSVTVVPEPVVYVSAFIAVLGLIGYRSVYG